MCPCRREIQCHSLPCLFRINGSNGLYMCVASPKSNACFMGQCSCGYIDRHLQTTFCPRCCWENPLATWDAKSGPKEVVGLLQVFRSHHAEACWSLLVYIYIYYTYTYIYIPVALGLPSKAPCQRTPSHTSPAGEHQAPTQAPPSRRVSRPDPPWHDDPPRETLWLWLT